MLRKKKKRGKQASFCPFKKERKKKEYVLTELRERKEKGPAKRKTQGERGKPEFGARGEGTGKKGPRFQEKGHK